MAIKNNVTVVIPDKLIIVDDIAIEFENDIKLNSDHKNLWALQWHDKEGELEFTDIENYKFNIKEYNKIVAPYVKQWETEKVRQEAIAEEERRKEEEEYNKIENVEARAREQRNKLLATTDYIFVLDSPISEEKRQEWLEYRQALRDLPKQDGWPIDIVWPEKPE